MDLARKIACVACLWLLASAPVVAQCVNTPSPSCGVYSQCFSHLCSCSSSPYEYFISYGEKYCKTFLDLPGLSAEGKAWRDSTLKCLQETIVPMLPPDGQASTCDCKQMQVRAFDSHVACYTKPGASICSLGYADWMLIFNTVGGVSSLTDQKNRKQMLEVAKVCLADAGLPDDVRSVINNLANALE
jgi:hypothetical protein